MKALLYLLFWPFILAWKFFTGSLQFMKSIITWKTVTAIGACLFFIALIPIWLLCPGIIIGAFTVIPIIGLVLAVIRELLSWF